MQNMKPEELLRAAADARSFAYAPYSNFRVGAALLTQDGRVFLGANVENSSYSATICAERSAFAAAVSSGARSFAAIAIVGAPGGQEPHTACPPCGVCLQVMAEFCGPNFPILLMDGSNGVQTLTLKELLPRAFRSENLCE